MSALLHDYQRRVRTLRRRVWDAEQGLDSSAGLRLMGVGRSQILGRIVALERRLRSLWNMQPVLGGFDPDDPSFSFNERAWERGVDLRLITTERTSVTNPIGLAQLGRQAWIGPASLAMMIINDEFILVEGSRAPTGEVTAWCSTAAVDVEEVRLIFSGAFALSRPAFPERVSLTARQVRVARAVARGWSDARTARELGVSLRTAEREVATVVSMLGAGSRTEAVSRMNGRV